MQKREHHLEEHLNALIVERLHTPFKWGENDCALFAADAIQAVTGVDIAEEFRGKYATERTAWKAIKKIAGGTTVSEAAAYCAARHNLIEHEFPLMAKRGDLVVVRNRDGKEIAAIVGLRGHPIAPGDDGLVQFSITDVVRAWKLPDEHEWTIPAWHPQHPDNLATDTSLPALPEPSETDDDE